MSFNKIILVGNLGRDPELRYTPQGTPVCSFSMATNERRKDKAGDFNDVTTWFRVTLWGRQAETAQQYLTKGRPVYIEGRLRVEEYTDKEGKQRHSLEVNATDMQFIGGQNVEGIPVGRGGGGGGGGGQYEGGGQRGGGGGGGAQRGGGGGEPDIEDDDIPF
ncbi:MAG TPA: single-stranded DNA-binding protein [Pyrinomonadaceae bacterium]|nr:single-stranded DNA-binding protein [Pyrinomonadaceae bacterium]